MSAIYIVNPNNFSVNVSVFNWGIVPLNAASGVEAWFQYYSQSGTIVGVPANGTAFMFAQPVRDSGDPTNPTIFGGVANISISGNAQLDFYDIAYLFADQVSVVNQAPRDASMSRRRGVGNGYRAAVNILSNVANLVLTGMPEGFLIGSPDDSVGSPPGADLAIITDPNSTTAPLNGAYGERYFISWRVTNSEPIARTYRLYGGNLNTGGGSGTNFIIYYTGTGGIGLGGCRRPSPLLTPGYFLPFIEDTIPPNGETDYGFTAGTVGGFSYPLMFAIALQP